MTHAALLTEIWRADILESQHFGHAVICDENGEVIEAWGDPEKVILPRSSSKMLQALPLVESGAADAAGLTTDQLALACASHNGAHIHTDRVKSWLDDLGLNDDDLRCGAHMPRDPEALKELTCSDTQPCQRHNNCSGKHTGFLTLNRHLGGGPEYIDPDHPVQKAVREAYEDMTGVDSPSVAIDGCSAPNFATTMRGMARAMARFATAGNRSGVRDNAAARLRQAMVAFPELVAGEGRACTKLMRAMDGRAAVKTGAEAVFVAMVPEKSVGVAVKIDDGSTRASEATIAALLVRLGVLGRAHPVTRDYVDAPIRNWRGIETGTMRPGPTLR